VMVVVLLVVVVVVVGCFVSWATRAACWRWLLMLSGTKVASSGPALVATA